MAVADESYFVDPNNHVIYANKHRYIVKMFCRQCNKIWDKRDCQKYIRTGELLTIKHRGQIIEQMQIHA